MGIQPHLPILSFIRPRTGCLCTYAAFLVVTAFCGFSIGDNIPIDRYNYLPQVHSSGPTLLAGIAVRLPADWCGNLHGHCIWLHSYVQLQLERCQHRSFEYWTQWYDGSIQYQLSSKLTVSSHGVLFPEHVQRYPLWLVCTMKAEA